jgi:DNA-binding HxlR family transcriptional regulator
MPRKVRPEGEAKEDLLDLLADDWRWLAIRELARAPKRQEELEQALPPLSPSAINERLHRLLHAGIAAEQRISTRPPRVAYRLTVRGREVGAVRHAAARWERRASPTCRAESQQPGSAALVLLADDWNLPIMRGLAVGSRRREQLETRIPGLSEGTLDRRLVRLRDVGVVRSVRHRGQPAWVEYELTPAGRWLPTIALHAMCWEWRWTSPARPAVGTDLAGLVRLTAPLVRIASGISGVCELAIRSPTAIEPSTLLSVLDGTITILRRSQRRSVDVRVEATPLAWSTALLSGDPKELQISGSAALARQVLGALRNVLSLDWLG